ncbi:Crp/Fnr family transcriptional regulator [Bifidobacterium myosotis]|uniref:Crp/Fnr family transcriptional regulator n=1 Tax=Bifidobacterium myosotis TaxID=1630166 RepID=A0A261FMN7_9BIFI|nr:ATP-binding protein [Bifidobacterium myosotis]OZG60440.1 Crp/Fnr family transcriptional regulator [Bifidobacterium myosotis]
MGTAAHISAGIDAGYSGTSNLTYDYARHSFATAGLDWGNVAESLSIDAITVANTIAVAHTSTTTDANGTTDETGTTTTTNATAAGGSVAPTDTTDATGTADAANTAGATSASGSVAPTGNASTTNETSTADATDANGTTDETGTTTTTNATAAGDSVAPTDTIDTAYATDVASAADTANTANAIVSAGTNNPARMTAFATDSADTVTTATAGTDADTAVAAANTTTTTTAATATTAGTIHPPITPASANPLLATLLSDQCPYATKAIIFDGDSKHSIRERYTFTGSLLSQLDEAGMLLNRINESGRYPAAALREALVNALEHRDYSYSGPTLINVFDSRLEIISLGGLTDGFAINDLLNGICQPRDPMLAQLLANLGLCEDCGTGVQRIMDAYAGNPISPQLRVGPSSVALVLPTLVEAANSPNPRNRGSASSGANAAAASSGRTDGTGHDNVYHFPTFQRVTDQAAEALAGARVIGCSPLQTLVLGRGFDWESYILADGHGGVATTIPTTIPTAAPAAVPSTGSSNGITNTHAEPAQSTIALASLAAGAASGSAGPVSPALDMTTLRQSNETLEQTTLNLLASSGVNLSRRMIQEQLGLSRDQAGKLLRQLTLDGKITKHGRSRATTYSIV